MPTADGEITCAEVRRMKAMASQGMTNAQIAAVIGCGSSTVGHHIKSMMRRRRLQAAQYQRFMTLASAYVPTFGAR